MAEISKMELIMTSALNLDMVRFKQALPFAKRLIQDDIMDELRLHLPGGLRAVHQLAHRDREVVVHTMRATGAAAGPAETDTPPETPDEDPIPTPSPPP